jgi:hypothetical protein
MLQVAVACANSLPSASTTRPSASAVSPLRDRHAGAVGQALAGLAMLALRGLDERV